MPGARKPGCPAEAAARRPGAAAVHTGKGAHEGGKAALAWSSTKSGRWQSCWISRPMAAIRSGPIVGSYLQAVARSQPHAWGGSGLRQQGTLLLEIARHLLAVGRP